MGGKHFVRLNVPRQYRMQAMAFNGSLRSQSNCKSDYYSGVDINPFRAKIVHISRSQLFHSV